MYRTRVIWREHGAPRRESVTGSDVDEGGAAALLPSEVMCVEAGVPAAEVLRLCVEGGLTAVAVVDDEGRPIGIVSRADLLRAVKDGRVVDDERYEVAFDPSYCAPSPRTAACFMASPAVVLPARASLEEGSRLLAGHRIHQAPVVDDEGRLVGVLDAIALAAWVSSVLEGAAAPPAIDGDAPEGGPYAS